MIIDIYEGDIVIGYSIPSLIMKTIELEISPVEQGLYDAFYDYLCRRFKGGGGIGDPGHGDGHSRSRGIDTDGGKVNYRKFRRLCYLSFSPLLEVFYRCLGSMG